MELEEKFKEQLIELMYRRGNGYDAINLDLISNECIKITEQYADEKYLNFMRYSTGWDKEFIKRKFEQYKQHIKSKENENI